MDSQESALLYLFIIFALIAGIAYVVRVLGSTEEKTKSYDIAAETKHEVPKPEVYHPTRERLSEVPREMPEKKSYVTVYRFSALRQPNRCPHCDAENPENTLQCLVCGCEIS